MKEVIELKDLAKYYRMGENIVKALDGINVKINDGEFVAIMGPSGSGKSTALNMVGALDIPTKGSIKVKGRDTNHMYESEVANLRGKTIGFIFQQFNLIPNLTAKENIMLPMTFQGMGNEEKEERAEDLLDLVELEDRMEHYPNQLSGGQQQRVAIARALANDPQVILADEPTGNLDTKTGEIVLNFLTKLNKKGKTIVMVTHDQHLATEHAEKVFWLKDGKIEKITKKVNGKWKQVRT
jgi:putative ABC transport system ATP-binding protein